MTTEMLLTLGILVAAIILFITEWLRVDVVALGVLVSLMLTGILNTDEAFSGFANPAVLTIAALFIVGGAVLQTGLAGTIGRQVLVIAGKNQTRLTIVIMLTVALLSGFMSDTGTVAVLLPAVVSLSWNVKISPTKLLLPLSYGALLGGAMTLIGTPPNIIVSDILTDAGLVSFKFFDYTPIGILLLILGTGFMALIGLRLLPETQTQHITQRVDTPEELVNHYRLEEDLYRLRVRRGSEIVDCSVEESRFRDRFNINILEIARAPDRRRGARLGDRGLFSTPEPISISPEPDTRLLVDDILTVQGSSNDVSHAAAALNLGVQSIDAQDHQALINTEIGLAEVLLPPRSTIIRRRSRKPVLARFTI